jgi:hypothetical protein
MKSASVPKDFVSPYGFNPKLGSDVSPLAAEYRPKRVCSTQNKAKRANKIVFLLLVRDQEVEGSNPFAPTIEIRPRRESFGHKLVLNPDYSPTRKLSTNVVPGNLQVCPRNLSHYRGSPHKLRTSCEQLMPNKVLNRDVR